MIKKHHANLRYPFAEFTQKQLAELKHQVDAAQQTGKEAKESSASKHRVAAPA